MPESLIAPAITRRAFCLAAWLAATVTSAGPSPGSIQPGGAYVQLGKPDQEEGRQALAQFRSAGIAGDYYLEFDLRVMPRRGAEQVFHGRLWGGNNAAGAVLRVAVTDGSGRERRLLIQNGVSAAVWRSEARRETPRVTTAFEPLVPGVELTAFDLQMPYLYWPDATLLSVDRVRGRPAHIFWFRPPAEWAAQHPEIGAVRASLDTQYHAPVQSELLNPKGLLLRTFSLVDLVKVGGQYIVKSVDLRNDVTRDKTRFQVTAAALGLELAGAVFEPVNLNDDLAPPEAAKLTRIAP